MRRLALSLVRGIERPAQPAPRAVPARLAVLTRQRSPRLSWEGPSLLLLLAGGVLIHADNLFNYPRYQLDEGTYVASAWAVVHGHISPYTYTYGHPPLGWTLMAAWIQAVGGFFSFGTAIDTGRVFMIWIYALSAVLVYLIARRQTYSACTALLAVTLFSFSPLSVTYQRQVLLDNIATFWMLLALYLLIASASRLRYIAASAAALGIACLSKETMIVFFPVFVYSTWLAASPFQRRFGLVVFCYVTMALVSTFVLLAILKGELFPSGTLFGGSTSHVSLIDTLAQQAERGSVQGSLQLQWVSWWRADALFMVGGISAIAGNLLLGRRLPSLRVIPLLAVFYWMFLARGGVTLAYYLLPLIPLQALNIAFCIHAVARSALSTRRWMPLRSRRTLPPWIVLALPLALLLLLVPYDLLQNRVTMTVNEARPEVEALQWVGTHVPRSSVIVANHYAWVDLSTEGGLATSYGVPYNHAEMYWEVATDPAIKERLLHNDWNNIDYVLADSDMTTDARKFHMGIILQAIGHAVAVKTFENRYFWVTIYQVQHRKRYSHNNREAWTSLL